MTSSEQKLLEEALRLPVQARADAEEAWAVEISRRVREIDDGKTKLIPWREARRMIMGG